MPDAPLTLLDDPARRALVRLWPAFLSPAEADELARDLADAPFEAERPVIFGRATTVRRQSCAFGDPGARYRYSGLLREAAPWPAALLTVLARLEATVGVRFTFALVNLYVDGAAALGWHADDEPDLAADQPIASLSLGATRDFQMRPRGGRTTLTVPLAHGSLLTMERETQRSYQHQVPRRARVAAPRINLTFRVMREARGLSARR
ncbi:MAG: alpha-ketoglutarate-dependent dioxygenase AlkB [Polyangiales bacterium]